MGYDMTLDNYIDAWITRSVKGETRIRFCSLFYKGHPPSLEKFSFRFIGIDGIQSCVRVVVN
jgi:hypothetical protein